MKNLDLTLTALLYEGAATNDPADADKIFNKINETAIVGSIRHQLQIATGVSNQAVALPNATCLYLIVLTDTPISINVNSSLTAEQLQPRAQGTKTFAYYLRGAITSLVVSNSSGATASVDILIANK
jgi:hypothetical protein